MAFLLGLTRDVASVKARITRESIAISLPGVINRSVLCVLGNSSFCIVIMDSI